MNSSELILNEDGTIYHLNIDESHINEYIITVGDPERVEVVSNLCDEVIEVRGKREFVTHIARIGDKRVTIISTGIGTDNIDIVMTELHALFERKKETETLGYSHLKFIRLGTSGSINNSVEVDSIVINSAVLGLDLLMHYYNLEQSDEITRHMEDIASQLQLPLSPYYVDASENLVNSFSVLDNSVMGIGLTACGFYAPQGRDVYEKSNFHHFFKKLQQIEIRNRQITNMEMETAGIYGMAEVFGHEAISINAILAHRLQDQFSERPKAATKDMIIKCLDVIRGM